MASSHASRRPLPDWFAEAGLGMFVHWGPFAVPAYAPLPEPGVTLVDLLQRDPRHMGARLPYSEWYFNAMRIPESATARHHRDVWHDAPYEAFRDVFEAGLDAFDAAAWADLFVEAGASYVVLVTKHHDGYCLWPTDVRHPMGRRWASSRDLVGEVAAAVRQRGLRFGVYYSTGLDWSVSHLPIRELIDSPGCIPRDPDYVRYVTEQLDELVDRYEPSVVWADIGTPKGFDVAGFKKHLLARVPDAVINDRWDPPLAGSQYRFSRWLWNNLVAGVVGRMGDDPFLPGRHPLADFRTPEYSVPNGSVDYAWEATRGLGAGFGHNAQETDAHRIDPDELVALYRSIRAAGGRLLLNVGPLADGSISEAEASRVRHLGATTREGRPVS
ncbi:MAG: alpha-L-fucosidase [Actinobacteria bacterium]|nr:alpha-L-fucosidase [Actinomycetota bacterium]